MIGMQLGCGLFTNPSYGVGLAETEFPVGSIARLTDPYVDYVGEKVSTFTKMPNGNWSSGSQHNEYFTNFEKLNFKRPVALVMSGAVELWPVDRRTPATPPIIDRIMVPTEAPVMLPNPNDAAEDVAPWSPPKPSYQEGQFVPGPQAPPQYTAAPAAKSSGGMLAVLAGLAFVFLR